MVVGSVDVDEVHITVAPVARNVPERGRTAHDRRGMRLWVLERAQALDQSPMNDLHLGVGREQAAHLNVAANLVLVAKLECPKSSVARSNRAGRMC